MTKHGEIWEQMPAWRPSR